LRGTQLVTVIEDRFRAIGVPADLVVTAPRVVEVDRDEFFPQIVRTRIAEVKTHPHGGPPGQLKKVAGVQTGAEIVHGERPHKQKTVVREIHVKPAKPPKQEKHENKGFEKQGHGGGGGKGHGKGKG